jgi:hypothetical protein
MALPALPAFDRHMATGLRYRGLQEDDQHKYSVAGGDDVI